MCVGGGRVRTQESDLEMESDADQDEPSDPEDDELPIVPAADGAVRIRSRLFTAQLRLALRLTSTARVATRPATSRVARAVTMQASASSGYGWPK